MQEEGTQRSKNTTEPGCVTKKNKKESIYSRGSQNGVHVPLGVHLGFSRGTLLCDRMFLFKLNSVSGRNNRLKCLKFSNAVDCNYVKQDN